MKPIAVVDGEIRFVTEWGGAHRFVFLPTIILEEDAGRRLSQEDAMSFVARHLARYTEEAREVARRAGNLSRIVIIARETGDQK